MIADAAAARVDEADAARLPRIKATAFGTISPRSTASIAACTMTEPKNFALRFSGVLRRRAARSHAAALHVRQDRSRTQGGARRPRRPAARSPTRPPVMSRSMPRARTGASSSRASSATCSTTASTRSARRCSSIERRRQQGRLDPGSPAHRGAARRGPGAARRGDGWARRQALAGLRALIGIADADIDDDELAADRARRSRRRRAATAARRRSRRRRARARGDELAEMAAAYYWPGPRARRPAR